MKQLMLERGLQSTLIALATGVLLTASCLSSARSGSNDGSPPAASAQKGGAELWAATCARCHNIRSPSGYSDAEWEVAMQHMRVRANLTGDEYRRILELMKAGN